MVLIPERRVRLLFSETRDTRGRRNKGIIFSVFGMESGCSVGMIIRMGIGDANPRAPESRPEHERIDILVDRWMVNWYLSNILNYETSHTA